MQTQVVVIGGGPGGYAAAFLAADEGLDVVLVEAEGRLGGTCLLRGCIPSKALIHAGEEFHRARGFASGSGLPGISAGAPSLNFAETQAWKDGIVRRRASPDQR